MVFSKLSVRVRLAAGLFAHADALAALVGLTDYHLLWLKASEWGIPATSAR